MNHLISLVTIFTYFIHTYLGKCWIQVSYLVINLVYFKFYSFVNILIISYNGKS
jgi:hypothetical protein